MPSSTRTISSTLGALTLAPAPPARQHDGPTSVAFRAQTKGAESILAVSRWSNRRTRSRTMPGARSTARSGIEEWTPHQSMREDSFWRTQIAWRAPVLDQGNG
jgi:hypothetical protein